MEIKRAIITAAGKLQRTLPLQNLVDQSGNSKTALAIIVEEVLRAGIDEICLVVYPGDQLAYKAAAGTQAAHLQFVEQSAPLGYGHAVYSARHFAGDQPFLHLVADHLYVADGQKSCVLQLLEVAAAEKCAVSAVQSTHESRLPYYGTIGGRRIFGRNGVYEISEVIEKPTPTEAEQKLIVPGQRAGHYLCFFGIHVLTPTVFELLSADLTKAGPKGGVPLASALAALASRERYLASELHGRRYDIGLTYGLLTAQLALVLDGKDRDEVLGTIIELLAVKPKS